MPPGPRNLITDVPGLRVGNADDKTLKSGCTVLTADAPFAASCAVMGGAPGTRDTDLLEPDKLVEQIDALVLSGGSAYGLGAADGVMAGLRAAGRGFAVAGTTVPLAPAAILFDLANGGDKGWRDTPYPALGRAAYDAATQDFAMGRAGAGMGATTACLMGGLGSASCIAEGATIGALVAVNPVGCVTTPGERHFWAAHTEMNAEFGGLGPDPRSGLGDDLTRTKLLRPQTATTIAIVATDLSLTKAQCKRMAVAAHDGIARAIWPAHTPYDGDLVFSLATGSGGAPAGPLQMLALCHAAALCLSRAIARAVYLAEPLPGDPLPCWRDVNPR